eukprot:UC4_evm1s581
MAGLERMRREAKMSEMQLREQIKYFDISIKEQNFRSRPPPRKAEWNVDFTDKKIMMSTPSKDNLDTRVQFESVTPIPHPPRRRIRSSPSKGSQGMQSFSTPKRATIEMRHFNRQFNQIKDEAGVAHQMTNSELRKSL